MELRSKSMGEEMGEAGTSRENHDDIRIYQEDPRPIAYHPGTQIYHKLPTFCGNKKITEIGQTWNVEDNLCAFLTAIDEHIDLLQITDEKTKIEILKTQIVKDRGDAIFCINSMKPVTTYEKVKDILRKTYGVSNRQTLRNAAIVVNDKVKKGLNLGPSHVVEEIHKFCNDIQAVSYAFLMGENLEGTKLEPNHTICHKGGLPITLIELINAAYIHIFLSPMLSDNVYRKIKGVRPQNNSIEMATSIIETIRELTSTPGTNTIFNTVADDTIFKLFEKNKNSCEICNRNNHLTENCRMKLECTNCKYKGHLAKDCRKPKTGKITCRNCDRRGHSEKDCWKSHKCLICSKKGHMEEKCFKNERKQFCQKCKNNSHSTEKCRRKPVSKDNRRVLNIDEIDIRSDSPTNE